ncbi:MA3 domain-containing protein [Prunus yedoensis var. nudiflora]|uniref:MA3 domain-containing protein n=1 Tax=Prunus yedoensis var. nudiflora TaxID=2094558 RepID=A0A314ZSW8_PRUYE|nr:MA3 domain-containing protein [Prunus yedoensis var. nudiflora]
MELWHEAYLQLITFPSNFQKVYHMEVSSQGTLSKLGTWRKAKPHQSFMVKVSTRFVWPFAKQEDWLQLISTSFSFEARSCCSSFRYFSGLRTSDLDIRLLLLFLARDPGQAQKKRALVLDSVLLDFKQTEGNVKNCQPKCGDFVIIPEIPDIFYFGTSCKSPCWWEGTNGWIAVRHVRRSHSGKFVRVKKEGGGGKGTWGKLLDADSESPIDRNDPNYDSGEQEPYQLVGSTITDPLDEYKKAVVSIIEEYFSTGDVALAASDLKELGSMVDDILPPAFLTRAKKALPESSKGVQVIQTAEKSYLSAPHHAELVERRWGGSTHITVEEMKKKIAGLLREYVESGDTFEACRCIRELGVSFFHHEVVKRALILAMEIRTSEPLIMKLLKEAAEEGLISSSQMVKGFSRLAETLDDLALDIPSANTLFESLVPKAISEGWLDASFLKSSGEDGGIRVEDEKVKRYKKEIVAIIHEYFLSDDIPELIRSLEDLGVPQYNPLFLKKLITLAMDRKNREKEMASVLLSALHIEIFSTEDIVNGFVLLLESAEDTELDILDASNELALFLARAVIDDVLAPLNLEEMQQVAAKL